MPRRQERRPNGAESQLLTVRVPLDLYAAAQARAAERDETLSAAVIAFLRRYIRTAHGAPHRQVRRPNGAQSKLLPVKVPKDLYEAAMTHATERGEKLSPAVVAFLRRYTR